MAKFASGTQMNMHNEFHKEFKEMKNDRVKKSKEKNGELSDKRFSLAIAKAIKTNHNGIRDALINADIDLTKE